MVTSLPSVSVSLSLSLSPKVPHAHYRKRFRASYNRTGQNLIICLGFSITRRAARAIQERVGTKRANFLATESVNFSATMVRQEVWREKRKLRFFGKGKCELTAIVLIFGMGKCKFIANFSATMMTSLPSIFLSLSLCISLSLSRSLYDYGFSHRARCTKTTPLQTWLRRWQRLRLYDYGTTERSFNAVERRGSTLTWTVCTAADSEER